MEWYGMEWYGMVWNGMVWNGMPVCMLIHVQWKWFQHVSKLVDTAILPSLCPSNTLLMCQRKIIALAKSAKQRNMLKHPAFHVFFCLVRWQTTGNPWSTGPLKRWTFISHNFLLQFNSTTSRPTLLSVTAEWHGSRDHFWTDIFQSEHLDFLFSQGACGFQWFPRVSFQVLNLEQEKLKFMLRRRDVSYLLKVEVTYTLETFWKTADPLIVSILASNCFLSTQRFALNPSRYTFRTADFGTHLRATCPTNSAILPHSAVAGSLAIQFPDKHSVKKGSKLISNWFTVTSSSMKKVCAGN